MKKNKDILVCGHRRSGNHFLMEAIEKNFDIGKIQRCHYFYNRLLEMEGEELEEKIEEKRIIYIVRDVRDVLTSCYYWWKNSDESKICNVAPMFERYSFSEYLRGEVPIREKILDEKASIGEKELKEGIFKNPARRWQEHVNQYIRHVPFIKYECLNINFSCTMRKVGDILDLDADNYKPVNELVGYQPRKGIVGDYKNLFSNSDLDYLYNQVGDFLKDLDYEL